MKRILFILLLTIPFIGFGQNQYDKVYYENGQLEYEGNFVDGKQDGIWKHYYESGQLKKIVNWRDGKPNGLKESYYENGQLEKEGKYKDGEQDGIWKYYYESGQLKSERNFIFSSSQQYRYQIFKYYYKNKKIKEEGGGLVGGDMDRLLIYRITWDENGNKTVHVDNRKQVGFPEDW